MGFRKVTPPLKVPKIQNFGTISFLSKNTFWKFRYYIINVKIWPDEKGSISLIAKIFRPRFARLYTIFSRSPLTEPIFMVKTLYFFLAALRADLLKSPENEKWRYYIFSVHFAEIQNWRYYIFPVKNPWFSEGTISLEGGLPFETPWYSDAN